MALSAYDPTTQTFPAIPGLPVQPGSLTGTDLERAIADGVARATGAAVAQAVALINAAIAGVAGGTPVTTPPAALGSFIVVDGTADQVVDDFGNFLIVD